jgi:hypothetical protein
MRWITFIIALAVPLSFLGAAESDRDCSIGGAWIRRDYADSIVAGKSPYESFRGARPVSALIISPGCDSICVVNNFHEWGLYIMEQRPDSIWDLFEIIQHEYRYSYGFMARDSLLVLVEENGEYAFVRYPDKYDKQKMPTEFVNERTIAGSYLELYPDSGKVSFLIGGGIEGLGKYLRYEVGFDFVLDHCDYMLLFGPNRADFRSFFWAFRGDTLELQPYDCSHCRDTQDRTAAFKFVRLPR